MKWFGRTWGAPINKECEETSTPTTPCCYCGKLFKPDDFGVVMPFHGEEGDPPEVGYHHHCLAETLGIDPCV